MKLQPMFSLIICVMICAGSQLTLARTSDPKLIEESLLELFKERNHTGSIKMNFGTSIIQLLNPWGQLVSKLDDRIRHLQKSEEITNTQISEAVRALLLSETESCAAVRQYKGVLLDVYSLERFADQLAKETIASFVISEKGAKVNLGATKAYLRVTKYKLSNPLINRVMALRDSRAYLRRQALYRFVMGAYYKLRNKKQVLSYLKDCMMNESEWMDDSLESQFDGHRINVMILDKYISTHDLSFAKSGKRLAVLRKMQVKSVREIGYLENYFKKEVDALKSYLQIIKAVSFLSLNVIDQDDPPFVITWITMSWFPYYKGARCVSSFMWVDMALLIILLLICLFLFFFLLKTIAIKVWRKENVCLKLNRKVWKRFLNAEASVVNQASCSLKNGVGRFGFVFVLIFIFVFAWSFLLSYANYFSDYSKDVVANIGMLRCAYIKLVLKVLSLFVLMFMTVISRYKNIGYSKKAALLWFLPIINVVVFFRCLVMPKDTHRQVGTSND
ncbi:MAG: hypothetical protein PHY48_16385 [Candidatus Cloacimonetes bacterium]|nr:hypothetical protein [Candidatus Cloacimonadota bacterium]